MSAGNAPFVPIDEAAKLAGPLLLRADDGTLHSGCWSGSEWTYASTPHHAINRPIAAYLPRKGRNNG